MHHVDMIRGKFANQLKYMRVWMSGLPGPTEIEALTAMRDNAKMAVIIDCFMRVLGHEGLPKQLAEARGNPEPIPPTDRRSPSYRAAQKAL